MPSADLSGPGSSLRTAARLLRERWWVVVLCAIIGAAALVLNDQRKPDLYEATATLQFGTAGSNVSSLVNSAASNVSADPQRDQNTTLLLVTSTSVANRVKSALRYAGPAGDLSAQVAATAEADANLIDVTATDEDPARAAQLANAFAAQYQAFRRDTDRAGLREGIQTLTAQLGQVPATATADRARLSDSIANLEQVEATTTGGVQVVDSATPPGDRASPRPKRDGLLGAVLGLAVGAVLIFGLDLLDRRLKDVEDFEDAYGQPSLVAVPLQRRTPRTTSERQAAVEPFRILRLSLSQVTEADRPKVVLVTSALPGEGKTTVAAGLARATAFAGLRVALVDLDLRRPSLHAKFGYDPEQSGVVALLRRQATLEEVVVHPDGELPNLAVVPAGGLASRSAEMLSSSLMGRTLDQMMGSFDVVVLDTPPLLPVADTHALLNAGQVDTCLVVAHAGVTTREQATRARALMHQHDRDRFGLVVNQLKRDADAYSYRYGDGEPEGSSVFSSPIS